MKTPMFLLTTNIQPEVLPTISKRPTYVLSQISQISTLSLDVLVKLFN
jgi:hypothetical protein